MSVNALIRNGGRTPTLFEDFFKPWNEWFDTEKSLFGNMLTVPAVNIEEHKDNFTVSLAVPGMKKDDFNIDVDGNMLTISCEKEEKKEETAAVTGGVTLEQVRKVLGEKINDFRPQIREKLTSLGAKNISTVSESDYDAFYKFLNELK